MQFTVLINQQRCLEWGLNLQEAVLFSYIYEMPSWARSMHFEGETYYWCAKGKIIDELPILSDKPDTIKRHLASLLAKGLVKRLTQNNMSYFALTEKAKAWNKSIQTTQAEPSDAEQVGKKIPTKGDEVGKKIPTKGDEVGKKIPTKGGEKSPQGGEKNPPNQITIDQITNDQGRGAAPNGATPLAASCVIAIPTNRFSTTGEEFLVTPEMFHEFQNCYPAVDVMQELREIRSWGMSNPKQRKTMSGMLKHINAWLAKEQDRGGSGNARPTNSTGARQRDIDSNDIRWAQRLRRPDGAGCPSGQPPIRRPEGHLPRLERGDSVGGTGRGDAIPVDDRPV